ncbi:MAG: energy-coupling factor transporter ATPase [Clostridia bacterium]|nr:energy-coupling factor transporter ATPase [Clostridia bacterium]
MPLISLNGVSFSYEKNLPVIKNLSLSVESGEYIAIVGHNGSGKSTLAKIMNGLLQVDEGEVIVDGFKTSNKKDLFEVRRRVGVVFQNPDNQLVSSIVEDDVAFGAENIGLSREEIGKRIEFALNAVGMEKFRKSTPTRLSGGQKQRIAIAGVLALMPKVLVLDESTAMLDPKGRKEVLSVVKKLNKEQGVTVIAITHYMEETVDADRVIVLDKGKIAMQGTPQEIFKKKDEIVSLGLELPPVAILAEEIRKKGIELPDCVLTESALLEALCK